MTQRKGKPTAKAPQNAKVENRPLTPQERLMRCEQEMQAVLDRYGIILTARLESETYANGGVALKPVPQLVLRRDFAPNMVPMPQVEEVSEDEAEEQVS